jgi:hypothetical protein
MAAVVEETFPGFWHPDEYEVGFTKLPHEFIEEMPKMSDTELRIVLYILRHTWGYQEIDNETSRRKIGRGKKITTDEFMHGRKRQDGSRMDSGTGLSDRGVKNGIEQAIRHGYIICEVNDHDKARIKKYYSLKLYRQPE